MNKKVVVKFFTTTFLGYLDIYPHYFFLLDFCLAKI